MKRKMNHLLKKTAAVAAASVMAAAAVPVMAEGTSYQEREKAGLASAKESLAEGWDAQLAEAEKQNSTNAKVGMTLTLDEAGQSMLGMMAGMDASWMKNISLNMTGSVEDGSEAVTAELLVNDTKICDMNVLMDFLTAAEYIQIPELTESWMKAALTMAEGEAPVSADFMKDLTELASDPGALFPAGKDFSELVDRYGTILLDHVQDGAAVEETVSVEGISEDCTLLEGQILQADFREIAKDVLTTAKEDEQLESVLAQWSEVIPDAGDLNAQFQSFAEETLADLEAEPEADDAENSGSDSYAVSRIWVNDEDKIVGRELALCTGVDTDVSVTWKAPKDGDTSAFLLDMVSDGSGFTLTGTSQDEDGVKTGNYSFAMDGITIMEIAAEVGTPESTYTVTFPQDESGENYNPMSLFSLVLTVNDESETTGDMNLALLSSGAQLGSLNIHVEAADDAAALPSVDEMETVYDVSSEEDMKAYEEEMNLDAIIANLETAGVPSELASALTMSVDPEAEDGSEDIADTLEGEITEEAAETEAADEAEEEAAE